MILFDLDGTLVDTAPDLGYALNLQRERHGLDHLPMEAIRPFASHGSKGLLSIGFDLTPEDKAFETMRVEYLDLYDQVFTRSPVLFDGVGELLTNLHQNDIKWGVVTNKPRRFAAPLIESMQLSTPMACLVCGDDAALPKPAPDTLFMACEQSLVKPERCFYVGDAERDIEAGNAAGMKTVVALWGYIDVTDKPKTWGADFAINRPSELIELLV
ncbi:MAG: Phosphoglycolate phosphatase 2 [Pseudomonadota bacterium]|jgi:phosphoglycolate phosphatase